MERNDYQVEKASLMERLWEPWKSLDLKDLNRKTVQDAKLEFKKGRGAMGLSMLEYTPFGDLDKLSSMLPFDEYVKKVLNPLVKSGEISDGSNSPFDDRKLRYDRADILPTYNPDTIVVNFGATHFKAFLADQNRSDNDNLELQEEGKRRFGDRYAFLSRAPGIAVLPLFMDVNRQQNVTYVGERTNSEMGGFLNAVAGHLKFRENPETVDLMEDLHKEMEEEFGIKPNSIVGKPVFAGVYSNPIKGDLDFTFIAQTDVPASYVDSGEWMSRVKEREHKPLIKLASMADVKTLLDEGVVPDGRKFPLMYSARGALESLTEAELRRL